MPLRALSSYAGRWSLYAGRWSLGSTAVIAGLCLVGCGESGGKAEFSQKFEAPAGAANATPDPNAGKTRSELRRQEIEESDKEPVGKSKRRR